MSWRDRVDEALRSENTRNTSDTRDGKGASVPIVPSVPASASKVLRFWHKRLEALDPTACPKCMEAKDWLLLLEDACWLYENHGSYAVRHGWDAQSLFGVWVGYAPAGGLAQQLRGSRQVVFDGPRAVFRSWGVSSPANVGIARNLPTIWEIQ